MQYLVDELFIDMLLSASRLGIGIERGNECGISQDDLGGRSRVSRSAQQVALELVAIEGAEPLQLALGLDAFGADLQTEAVSHYDDSSD